MTWEWFALAGLALVALVLLAAFARLRARTGRDLDAARAEAAELRRRLDRLEQTATAPGRVPVDGQEYRITGVGDPGLPAEPSVPVELERAVFADLLLRESVIRLGSLAHGVRRALAPEARNRIRFEMRREVKRSRKQRRAEQREAYREWQARQRGRDDDLRDTA
jgi:hypothetical protein